MSSVRGPLMSAVLLVVGVGLIYAGVRGTVAFWGQSLLGLVVTAAICLLGGYLVSESASSLYKFATKPRQEPNGL